MAEWIETRINQIAQRLTADGFNAAEGPQGNLWHRRKFQPSRFGLVDTVVSLATAHGQATADTLRSNEEAAFQTALKLKTKLPRGVGSAVEVFSVTLAADASADAIEAAQSASKNRWSTMSTVALVYGPQQQIALFEGKRFWGGAYIKGLRQRLQSWLG